MPGRQRRRPRGHPALDRARARPGGAGAVPGHPARHRPADRERLLLRLRPRAALHARGPAGPREEDAARSSAPGSSFSRREISDADAADRARARAVQAGADRPQGRRGRRRRGRRRRGRRRAADHVRQPRRPHRRPGLDRPLPRPAPAAHQHHPGVLPHPQRRRLLARAARRTRSCSASTAPRGRARTPTRPTWSSWPRPSAATTAGWAPSWTCSASPTRSAPAWPSSTPRAA